MGLDRKKPILLKYDFDVEGENILLILESILTVFI